MDDLGAATRVCNVAHASSLTSGDFDFGLQEYQTIFGILLSARNLAAGQLARRNWIHPLNSMGHIAIGNALHFKHMKAAQFSNLLEGQRGVVDQPYGCRFRHQWQA